MKKLVIIVGPLALFACGGSSKVHLALNSNDAVASTTHALTARNAAVASGGGDDLTQVKSVTVTVSEVDVRFGDHASMMQDGGEMDGDSISDTDTGWQAVTTAPQSVDLISFSGTSLFPLGNVDTGKAEIEQVRIKLKTDGASGNSRGDDIIRGAVVDLNGAACDLLVPPAAANPGLKIHGHFQAPKLGQGTQTAVINIRLKNSSLDTTATTCAYRLSPEIEIERLDVGDDHDHEHGQEHADGGHP